MSMNFNLLKYWNPVFIETGTKSGDSVKKALKVGFKKIYSIELKEGFYDDCRIKFEKEIQKGRVELLLGDSVGRLEDVLKNNNCRATFWLDAHYSGKNTDTAKGTEDVPLLRELDLISKHHIKTHTILIDDVRLFGKNDGVDWSNIRLNDIIKILKNINPDYSVYFEKGIMPNDVLVAEIHRFSLLKILGKIIEMTTLFVRKMLNKIKSFPKD